VCKKNTWSWWKNRINLLAMQMYAINTSRSRLLPRLRKGSVAPPGDICVYIDLLGIYTYTLTTFFCFAHIGWRHYSFREDEVGA
jgi:hypothetical protein